MLARLTILLSLTLLAGCDTRTRLNPGADLAIYVGSAQHMFNRIPAGIYKGDAYVRGYYSLADGSITLNEQLSGMEIARTFAHELAHAYDHQQPSDMWELLRRYQSPRFDFNFHKE